MTDELQPSRELDAMVAEKIFAWEVEWIGGQPHRRYWHFDPPARMSSPVPHYSTSVAHAFLVVEEVSRHGWRFSLQRLRLSPNTEMRWIASFTRPDYREYIDHITCMTGTAQIMTAPHALCIAALRTLAALPEAAPHRAA